MKKLIKGFGWIFHILFGMFTVYSVKIDLVLPLIFFCTFILYELDEEWTIGDHAFEELREYGTGLAIALLTLLR